MKGFVIDGKSYDVAEAYFSFDGLRRFHAIRDGRNYLLSIYDGDGYGIALESRKKLSKFGIPITKLVASDPLERAIVYDMPDGENVLSVLAKGPLEEKYFEEIYRLYRFARFSKIALSWHPENFIMGKKGLVYLGEEFSPLSERTKLENMGIREWILGQEGLDHLHEKGYELNGVSPLAENVVNKQIVLISVSYW
jgi:hypothetical protein